MSTFLFKVCDCMHLNAEMVGGSSFVIHLANGKTISVEENQERPFPWKIDDQMFSREDFAERYLQRLIAEKLTGKRIIMHAKGKVPDICGVDGAACRHPGKCNSALCSYCPVADAFFAERDGVELIYAVEGES